MAGLADFTTKAMKRFVLCVAALALAGCYDYAPFAPSQANVGHAVRVQLTEQGSANAAGFIGPGVDHVDGRLSSLTDSLYTVSITDVGRRDGSEEAWTGDPLNLARGDIESIGLRKASTAKSTGLMALIVGGAALIARAIYGSEGTIRSKTGGTPGGQ
jgi:hypothetical protein